MATLRQIEANRLNAQKSTGPRSETGKANSSQNALKSGIYTKTILIPGEDWDEFEALLIEYHDHYLPQSPAERDLVDQLIRDTWQLRRFARVEVQMWERKITVNKRFDFFDEKSPLGQVFLELDETLARLHRMIAATKRSFQNALRELERLRSARAEAERTYPGADSRAPDPRPLAPAEQPPAPLTPFGFVPSTNPQSRHLISETTPSASSTRTVMPRRISSSPSGTGKLAAIIRSSVA